MRLIWIMIATMLTLLMQALMMKFWTYLMFLLLFKLVVIPTTIQLKLIQNRLISASLFSLLGGSRIVFNHICVDFSVHTVGCVVLMVVWSEFHMRQHRDDNNREDAPDFTSISKTFWQGSNHTSKNSSFSLNEKRARVLMGRRRSSTQMLYWQSSNSINL